MAPSITFKLEGWREAREKTTCLHSKSITFVISIGEAIELRGGQRFIRLSSLSLGWRDGGSQREGDGGVREKKESEMDREHSQSITVVILICPVTGCVQQQKHVFILQTTKIKHPSQQRTWRLHQTQVSCHRPVSKMLQRKEFLFLPPPQSLLESDDTRSLDAEGKKSSLKKHFISAMPLL